MSKTDELMALVDKATGAHVNVAFRHLAETDSAVAGCIQREQELRSELRTAIEQALEDEYDRGFKAAIHAVEAQPHPDPSAQPCIGNDPLCPCQDGLACHYKDAGNTKGWPIP